MATELRGKINKSIKWTVLVTLFNTTIQPIYRILLALLLLPTEYGYIAVITLLVSFAELLNNVGVGEAIIQRDNIDRQDLSTLFFFNLFITIFISVLVFLSAPFIHNFYEMEHLTIIIRTVTLIVFINGVTSIFKFYMHKNFLFKETSIIRIIKVTLEVVISLILILIGYSIWGYIFAVIISNTVSGTLLIVLAYKKTDLILSFYFSLNKLIRFLHFGIFVSMKKILTFFSQRIDEIIIGGTLSSDILGVYYLAKNLLLQIQSLISTSFNQVLLPTFSKIKNDKVRLKKLYLNIISVLLFVGLPLFILIILTAEYFVPLIFGNEWLGSVIVFQSLSLPVLCLLLSSGISTSLLYSQNKTVLVFVLDLVMVPLYILILIVFNNGLLENILVIYGSYLIIKFFIIQIIVSKTFDIKINNYSAVIIGTIMTSIIMTVILLLLKSLMSELSESISLLILSITSVTGFVLISFIINKRVKNNFFHIIKSIIKN